MTASRLLPNSWLLAYAGWGHTAFLTGNGSVDDHVTRYLVTTRVPARGTVCQPAGSPFAPSAAAAQSGSATRVLTPGLLPGALRRGLEG